MKWFCKNFNFWSSDLISKVFDEFDGLVDKNQWRNIWYFNEDLLLIGHWPDQSIIGQCMITRRENGWRQGEYKWLTRSFVVSVPVFLDLRVYFESVVEFVSMDFVEFHVDRSMSIIVKSRPHAVLSGLLHQCLRLIVKINFQSIIQPNELPRNRCTYFSNPLSINHWLTSPKSQSVIDKNLNELEKQRKITIVVWKLKGNIFLPVNPI